MIVGSKRFTALLRWTIEPLDQESAGTVARETADAMTPIGDILPGVLAAIVSRAKRAALEAEIAEPFNVELSRGIDGCVASEDQSLEAMRNQPPQTETAGEQLSKGAYA